tara:strand:+ start:5025 stop:5900 length:876 start_codon:yes stop_codon:yes gene_type:complete
MGIHDPRFAAMLDELKGINEKLANVIPNADKPDVSQPYDIIEKTKASTFLFSNASEWKIPMHGFIGAQISTDGDQATLSYKALHLGGNIDKYVSEASEDPHIPGPIEELYVENDTAESGKIIRVKRYKMSPSLLSFIQHGTPLAVTVTGGEKSFYAEKVEYTAGTDNYFETDQAMGATPTLSMTGTPATTGKAIIHTIKHQIIPTNAVTYQLYLLEDAQANDERQESDIIYDSGSGIASGTVTTEIEGGSSPKLPIEINLATNAKIYYMVDWSGAPGNTAGYIKVYGEVLS